MGKKSWKIFLQKTSQFVQKMTESLWSLIMSIDRVLLLQIRIIIFEIIFFLSFGFIYRNTDQYSFEKEGILGLLISVISIIVAIIVTYLFSKLFAEKTIKIERKKEIDQLSKKITWLRQIAFHIRNLHEFWRFNGNDIKRRIDNQFPDLTYEEYRSGIVEGRKLSYEEIIQLDEQIFGNSGQAYLAIKGLVDGESDFSMYGEFKPTNYSFSDIERYKEYAGSFWYLLDRSANEIVNFDGIHNYWLDPIDERYYKINGKKMDPANRKNDIKDLLSDFEAIYFRQHYFLSRLNRVIFSGFFSSFFNLLIFVLILVGAVFIYTIDLNIISSHKFSLILLAMFISNTVDLIVITITSIYREQNVTQIFVT